jgi:membrane fusion protein, multidrug efflux system
MQALDEPGRSSSAGFSEGVMMQRSSVESPLLAPSKESKGHSTATIVFIVLGVALVTLVVVVLAVRAAHGVNQVPLDASPRPVAVVAAVSAPYRGSRTYVGAIEPWVAADVGPQYISAYVETVLVRPGDSVKKGQMLATLDCSNPTEATRAFRMQAKSAGARQHAAADEATRVASLLQGGFVAPNESEQKNAVSDSEQAQLFEVQARVRKASLDERDCILRAPFDGEIATRMYDPGAFVRPGASIVSIVDRDTLRITVDATEKDFEAVSPTTIVRIDVVAAGAHISAPISRRAPSADPRTRTVHFEVDVADPQRRYPSGTTATVHVDVGAPAVATEVPIYAATQYEGKAKLFVVDHGVAHVLVLPVLGESGAGLFFSPSALAPGALVVTEGRALLTDGDKVAPRADPETPDAGAASDDAGPPARGGGYGRPL